MTISLYRLQPKQNRIILLLILGVCLFGDFLGVWTTPQRFSQPYLDWIERPVTQFWREVGEIVERGENYWIATQQLAATRQQYSQALTQLQELESLRAENKELRRVLENTDRTLTKTFLTAPVVSFAQPTVMIGSVAGVQPGAVVSSHGTVLGFLSTVTAHSAQVRLLTQPSTASVLVKTESGAQGLLKGDGRSVWVTEIPTGTPIAKNERVSTVGQDGIPKDLLIGTVDEVVISPQAAVLQVRLKQLVSFFTTDVVEVY